MVLENIEDEDGGPEQDKPSPKPPADLNRAYQLIQTAINRCNTEDEWVSLSPVGAALMAAHPDFDTRTYGYAKLSTLIKALPKLELSIRDNHPKVRIRP